jgi:IS30 family transposase
MSTVVRIGHLSIGGMIMTVDEKERIYKLRNNGNTYTQIAEILGKSVGTIKSYCSRNNIFIDDIGFITEDENTRCKQCGKHLMQTPGKKTKRFCSDTCRLKWWNNNRNKVIKKTAIKLTCVYCNNQFESYDNEKRKYCSHECYINDRFGA